MRARKATEQDIELIGRMAREIWQEHYPAIIGQEQTDFMLQHMYNPESLRSQMLEKGHQFYIWENDTDELGFASLDCLHFEHAFLAKFYLKSSFRGKGIAQAFLAFLESEILQSGKKTLELTVNRQNIAAINFYFKTGFKIIRVEDFDIGNGFFMNDFIMAKQLSA